MTKYLFAGVMDATMLHNEGWHFGQIEVARAGR